MGREAHLAGRSVTERIYFPGLNALRFLAAFCVLIQHVVQFQVAFGQREVAFVSRFFLSGRQSVLLFFVLSGFLITYLLLAEREKTETIGIRKFYIRRILRIWPLYYLIVFLSFIVLPIAIGSRSSPWPSYDQILSTTFLLFLLLLPNVAASIDRPVLGASHLWSIGVEEQFYLVWPLLMKRFAAHPVALMLSVVAVKIGLLWGLDLVSWRPASRQSHLLLAGRHFLADLSLESMAIGGLGAWLVFRRRERYLRIVFHPATQAITLALLAGIVYASDRVFGVVAPLSNAVLSLVFVVVILNVSCNPASAVSLENRVFDYLGRISYGIYMFHPAVIILVLLVFRETGWSDGAGISYHLTVYLAAVGGTLAVAAASYRFFEMPWLNWKDRFAIVPSGGAAVGRFREARTRRMG